ncbi:MAG: family 10 glycosylhydrolase [Acidobacteria bacterium]|nr:family 10 glycosylhydrolase [Acidobacteriota bacterium]
MVRQSLRSFLGGAAGWALLALLGCGIHGTPAALPPPADPPPAPREFRAVWVATVANIDWPSARDLPVEAQQAEARAIVAKAAALGLNAIIFQVRPACDALYASPLEPWSEFLTGEQGKAPEPFYDPLAFWIDEAHRAGLELHAWFNPYRARHSSARSPLAPGHIASTRPAIVKAYGNLLWLDPGEPQAADHSLAVIRDVVRRYDVDGVHIDDYFYPYPVRDERGLVLDFPDAPSWSAFAAGGGSLSCADWRRRNVDRFVERLFREVRQEKPTVRVGVSPFGVGRPDRRPPGVGGFSQYDEIYADVESWLEQGWMDYLAPQLYWKRDSRGQPFAPLLESWRSQNPAGRHVWPGLFTSQTGAAEPWPAQEIAEQIRLVREAGGSQGHVHFSMVALTKDWGGLGAHLKPLYERPALVPATPWLGEAAPDAPSVDLRPEPGSQDLRIDTAGTRPWLLALWARYGGPWRFFILPGGSGRIPGEWGGQPLEMAQASAVGRTGLESPRVAVRDGRKGGGPP